jgi:hypothetical protein
MLTASVDETDLASIVDKINARAGQHDIGCLQKIRQRLKNSGKLAAKKVFHTRKMFVDKSWTFHIGGRTELQFNLGLEKVEDTNCLRHGVAFSFEPSRNHAWNDLFNVLRPKVKRFNEFLRHYPEEFRNLRMWHWRKKDGRSKRPDRPPSPIQQELRNPDVFVFLGRLQPVEAIDYDIILNDPDRLLPLYEFVEGTSVFLTLTHVGNGFHFEAGYTEGLAQTTANVPAQELDVDLRHNALRKTLYLALSQRFGTDAVSSRELPNGIGGRIDTAVKQNGGYWFYEIKTALSARACIREALAQLMEYAYWPGAQEAKRLIIVGEPVLCDKAKKYLARLRQQFSLPVHYQQLNLEKGVLVPAELEP